MIQGHQFDGISRVQRRIAIRMEDGSPDQGQLVAIVVLVLVFKHGNFLKPRRASHFVGLFVQKNHLALLSLMLTGGE